MVQTNHALTSALSPHPPLPHCASPTHLATCPTLVTQQGELGQSSQWGQHSKVSWGGAARRVGAVQHSKASWGNAARWGGAGRQGSEARWCSTVGQGGAMQ